MICPVTGFNLINLIECPGAQGTQGKSPGCVWLAIALRTGCVPAAPVVIGGSLPCGGKIQIPLKSQSNTPLSPYKTPTRRPSQAHYPATVAGSSRPRPDRSTRGIIRKEVAKSHPDFLCSLERNLE